MDASGAFVDSDDDATNLNVATFSLRLTVMGAGVSTRHGDSACHMSNHCRLGALCGLHTGASSLTRHPCALAR